MRTFHLLSLLEKFHVEQAIAFYRRLEEARNKRTGNPISKATALQTLNALRAFLLWVAEQPGCRGRIRYSDADYSRLSEKDTHAPRGMQTREALKDVHICYKIIRARLSYSVTLRAASTMPETERMKILLNYEASGRRYADFSDVELCARHADLSGRKLTETELQLLRDLAAEIQLRKVRRTLHLREQTHVAVQDAGQASRNKAFKQS